MDAEQVVAVLFPAERYGVIEVFRPGAVDREDDLVAAVDASLCGKRHFGDAFRLFEFLPRKFGRNGALGEDRRIIGFPRGGGAERTQIFADKEVRSRAAGRQERLHLIAEAGVTHIVKVAENREFGIVRLNKIPHGAVFAVPVELFAQGTDDGLAYRLGHARDLPLRALDAAARVGVVAAEDAVAVERTAGLLPRNEDIAHRPLGGDEAVPGLGARENAFRHCLRGASADTGAGDGAR